MKSPKLLIGLALASSTICAGRAEALTFILADTGGAGIGTQARQGFDIATRYWSSVLLDDVSVNLNIGFRSLGTGILGSTGSARSLLSMSQGYGALAADRSSTVDSIAVANLQPLGVSALSPAFGAVSAITNAFNATGNGYIDTAIRFDNDGSTNNSTLAVTKANAKALGLTTDVNGNAINFATSDGNVTFSTNFDFDFDPTDGILSTTFDFIGVAIHEIGHALGFISGVDSYDARTAPSGPNATSGLLEGFVVMNSLDLFRYGAADTLDWSTQGTPYFSIDGGDSQVFGSSLLSTGSFNGDRRQASHFKDNLAGMAQLGILDPTSARGQLQEVTALDLAAFDAIGWNVGVDALASPNYRFTTAMAFSAFSAVPEPTTWAQMLLGFGAVGFTMRRRRGGVKTAFARPPRLKLPRRISD